MNVIQVMKMFTPGVYPPGRQANRNGYGGGVSPKSKRSAKSTAQQADRAYAEFEKLTKKLAKKSKSRLDAERAAQNAEKPPD